MKGFFLTLGVGMVAGGMVILMLPKQSGVRQSAQKAANTIEDGISEATHRIMR